MKELTVAATVENLGTVTDFVNEQLEALDCPMKVQMQLDIAIDEIFSNISNYAYTPGIGQATIRVEVQEAPLRMIITFIDSGMPYDPLSAADPDTTLSAEERAIGGLGVFMVKNPPFLLKLCRTNKLYHILIIFSNVFQSMMPLYHGGFQRFVLPMA